MLLTVGITASAQEALDSRHTIVSPEIHDDYFSAEDPGPCCIGESR